MNKERLEELLDDLSYIALHSGKLEPLKQFAREQAERVQELEEENRFQMSETHKNLDKVIYLDKEKERYKQALEQVEGFLVKANKFYVNNRDFAVNYNINEALEVIKELKGESE